jgi:hypothetical protein
MYSTGKDGTENSQIKQMDHAPRMGPRKWGQHLHIQNLNESIFVAIHWNRNQHRRGVFAGVGLLGPELASYQQTSVNKIA